MRTADHKSALQRIIVKDQYTSHILALDQVYMSDVILVSRENEDITRYSQTQRDDKSEGYYIRWCISSYNISWYIKGGNIM